MADTQRLAVDLSLKGNFNEGMGKAQKNLKGFTKQANTATKQTSKLGGSLRSMGKQAKGSILSGVGLGAGLVGFQLLTGAVSKTVDILGDSVRMAAEEEAGIAQLTRAIEANDESWDGNTDAIERNISLRQNELAFSDGEQRESLRLLVAFTKDATEAQRILGTAMDFSRLQGISLKTSSELLGKAFAGNTATLSRYGIIVKEGAEFTEILASVQAKADGQAKAYAATTEGKLTVAQYAMNDAMEDLGRTVTPVVADLAVFAADTIPDIVKGIQDMVGEVDKAQKIYLDLRDTVQETVGRDIENDLANLVRIAGTAGTALAFDAARDSGFLGDVQRNLQDVQRELVGVNEDLTQFGGDAGRATNTMGALATATDDTAQSQAEAASTGVGLATAFNKIAGTANAAAKAVADEVKAIEDFRDIAGEVKDTRDLGKINRALARQGRLADKAAEEGNLKKFAATQAQIKKLLEEKATRRAAFDALKNHNKGEITGQGKIATAIDETKDAAKKPAKLDIQTGNAQMNLNKTHASVRALLADVRQGATLNIGTGGGQSGGQTAKFHSGTDFVPRTGLAILQKGEAVIPAGQNRSPSIFVTPRIEVAASQVEVQTSRVVRTNRTRVNA